MTDKTTLRARMKALRAGLCSPERDAAIAGYVLSAFGEEQSFFVYLSFGSEVGTEALIRALLARGKTVCVPRIAGGEMCSVPYREPLERAAERLSLRLGTVLRSPMEGLIAYHSTESKI